MTTISAAMPTTWNHFRAFLRAHPLTAFILLAFSITWLLADVPLILAQNGFGILPLLLPSDLFIIVGTAIGMAGSAFGLTYLVDGKAGVTELLGRYTKWRVKPVWYVFVFFQAIVLLVATVIADASSVTGLIQQWKLVFTDFLPAALSILVFGQLWEELGWRGFLLPRLQPRYGGFRSSLILAGLQTLWHVPGFFFSGGITAPGTKLVLTPGYLAGAFMQTLIASLILGLIATWIFNKTKGSLLIIILFHTFSNASARMLLTHIADPLLQARVSSIASLALIALVVGILIFTRGKLGFRTEDSDEVT